MGTCEHLDINDKGICKFCGIDITSQEFIDSLPEAPKDPNLGDMMGIIRLAQATAQEFLNVQAYVRDPNNPSQPKIKWVGSQMVRPPRETIWTEVIRGSFAKAKSLGYRGTYERWDDTCMEYLLLLKEQKSPQKGS